MANEIGHEAYFLIHELDARGIVDIPSIVIDTKLNRRIHVPSDISMADLAGSDDEVSPRFLEGDCTVVVRNFITNQIVLIESDMISTYCGLKLAL